MTNQKLYHVTSIDNADSILEHGLRANADGKIFVFTDKGLTASQASLWEFLRLTDLISLADRIAKTQIFLPAYVLFAINPKGVTGRLETDAVGELVAFSHRVIYQAVIESKFVERVAVRQLSPLISKDELFQVAGLKQLLYQDLQEK